MLYICGEICLNNYMNSSKNNSLVALRIAQWLADNSMNIRLGGQFSG